jgi:isocitrate/isopropylmalate dehydrogenase
MMLKYSFDMPDEADLVENAVRRALAWGGTSDIVQPDTGRVSTRVIGDTVLERARKGGVSRHPPSGPYRRPPAHGAGPNSC